MGQAIMGGRSPHAAAFVPVRLMQEPPEVPFVPDPGVSENSILQNKNISANNLLVFLRVRDGRRGPLLLQTVSSGTAEEGSSRGGPCNTTLKKVATDPGRSGL